MKILRLVLMAIFLFTSTISNYGQESKHSKLGFGISIADIKDLVRILSSDADFSSSILLPIHVSSKLKIEPEIGFFITDSEDNTKTQNEKSKDYSDEFHVGIGIFPLKELGSYKLYYGLRVGYIHVSSYNEYNMGYPVRNESASNGFYLAPGLAGEYFFNNHFSLGGEVQFRFTSLSGEEKNDMNVVTDLSSFSFSTRTLLLIRCYF